LRTRLSPALGAGGGAGARLGRALLTVLDRRPPSDAADDAPPAFERPRAQAAQLPGGLHFLRVCLPRAAAASYESGRELVISADLGSGRDDLSVVRLDKSGIVSSIVHVGTEPVEVQNWVRLLGLPASVINRLDARFDEGILPPLSLFLREPWAMALFHDRFADFFASLKTELGAAPEVQKEVIDKVLAAGDERPRAADYLQYLPKDQVKLVKEQLKDLIETNQNQLSMYLVPSSDVMRKMEHTKLR